MSIVNPSGSPIVPATLAMVTVSLYSDVRALIAGQASRVEVLGGSVVGDGQDGVFYWNSTSTAADDGFATLAPNAGGTGRWIRIYGSFRQSGSTSTRTVSGKLQDFLKTPEDFGAVGNGTTNDLTAVNAAIAAAVTDGDKEILLNNDYYLSAAPTNLSGIMYVGPGKFLQTDENDATAKKSISTYATHRPYIEGREYLSAFHKKLIARAATTCIFSGDSTTSGTGVTTPYRIWELVPEIANVEGYYGVQGTNAGHSGDSTTQWLATYLAADMALDPDLYVIRWGINDHRDIGENLTVAQFITNIRTGLAAVRAHVNGPLASCSVVLMMPNSVSSSTDERDEKWMEAIYIGMRQAAKDYNCVFVDTYAFLQDSRNSSDWMDTSSGAHIHPANVMNAWISDLICEAILPRGMRQVSENAVRNVSGSFATKTAAALPSTYSKGVTISRATPGGGGAAWPHDGAVLNVFQADSTQIQFNWSYNSGYASVAMRVGQADAWLAWNYLQPRGQGTAVAAANNLALAVDGDYYQITGATQINLLSNVGWLGGAMVTLKFNSTPTVKHNQAASGNNKPIILNAAADLVAAASNTLTLRYDSTDAVWYEQSRKV